LARCARHCLSSARAADITQPAAMLLSNRRGLLCWSVDLAAARDVGQVKGSLPIRWAKSSFARSVCGKRWFVSGQIARASMASVSHAHGKKHQERTPGANTSERQQQTLGARGRVGRPATSLRPPNIAIGHNVPHHSRARVKQRRQNRGQRRVRQRPAAGRAATGIARWDRLISA
jgi:hypothetical protein